MIPAAEIRQSSTEDPQRWSSLPTFAIFGYIDGNTGGWYSWEDNWAKCRLNIYHEVYQVDAKNGQMILLGRSAHEVLPVFELEGNDLSEFSVLDFVQYPLASAFSFSLADQNANVFARAQLGIELVLEGTAFIQTGENRPPVEMRVNEPVPLGYSRWVGPQPK